MLPSADELRARYSSWPNRKLLSVILHKGQYTSLAVEIARDELGRRNITADDVDVYLHEQELQRNREKLLSNISLSFWEKLRCFFFWFVPSLVVRKGFILREQQTHLFSVAGFVSFFISGFVIVHFRLPLAAGLALLVLLFSGFAWYEKQDRRNLSS